MTTTGPLGTGFYAPPPRPGSARSASRPLPKDDTPNDTPERDAINDRVRQVTPKLKQYGQSGADAAKRLTGVWNKIHAYTPSAAYANIDPIGAAHDIERELMTWPARLAVLRNLLILIPLGITWFAIGKAAQAYQAELIRSPNDVAYPFLDLWQRGFRLDGPPNATNPLAFSNIAIFDVVLFGLLILIGLIVDAWALNARKRADAARVAMESVTGSICQYAAELRSDENGLPNMKAWSEELQRVIGQAASTALQATKNLTQVSEMTRGFQVNVDKLGESARSIGATAEGFTKSVEAINTTSDGIRQAARDLAAATNVVGNDLRGTSQALGLIFEQVATVSKNSAAIATQLGEASTSMQAAAATIMDAAKKMGGVPPRQPVNAKPSEEPKGIRGLFGFGRKKPQPTPPRQPTIITPDPAPTPPTSRAQRSSDNLGGERRARRPRSDAYAPPPWPGPAPTARGWRSGGADAERDADGWGRPDETDSWLTPPPPPRPRRAIPSDPPETPPDMPPEASEG